MPKTHIKIIAEGNKYVTKPLDISVEDATENMTDLLSNDLLYINFDLRFGGNLILPKETLKRAIFIVENHLD